MPSVQNDFLLILRSSGIGESEPDLGEQLMTGFLGSLLAAGELPARLICMNTAIFLTTAHGPASEILTEMAAAGSAVLSCGTCLRYYDREDRLVVGSVTNMKETAAAVQAHAKVVVL